MCYYNELNSVLQCKGKAMEEEIDKVRLQYKFSKYANMLLISVHVLMVIFFFLIRTYYLAYINIGSVVTYAVCFLLLCKRKLASFVYTIHIEIWIQMIACVVLLGWEYGFELFSFGLVFTLFFVVYTSNANREFSFHPVLLCAITTSVYIVLRIYSYYKAPYYNSIAYWIPKASYLVVATFMFITIVYLMFMYTNIVLLAEKELRIRADYDELTNLYNRHKIRDVLGHVYDEAHNTDKQFCITIMDIDDFKLINNSYGHDGGDTALAAFASMLRQRESKDWIPCRWGGEEFLVVQQFTGSSRPCIDKIESLRVQVAMTIFEYNKQTFPLTITAGISVYKKGESIASTIKRADNELYRGKFAGKNRVSISE